MEEPRYLNHSRAVEAIMRAFAGKNDDKEEWGLAGLLHDIDIGTTAGRPDHGVVGARMLRNLGFRDAIVHAVKAHDDAAGVPRTNRLDHALFCADQVYWLILSTGLQSPSADFNASSPRAIWQKLQRMSLKEALVAKVSKECAAAGLAMPDAIKKAHTAMRSIEPALSK